MTEYAHIITTLQKIATQRYAQFDYFEEDNYESAQYYDEGDILKVGNSFYKITTKKHISPLKEIPNLVVKHGRHTIQKFTI